MLPNAFLCINLACFRALRANSGNNVTEIAIFSGAKRRVFWGYRPQAQEKKVTHFVTTPKGEGGLADPITNHKGGGNV